MNSTATAPVMQREPSPLLTVQCVSDYRAFLDLEPIWNRLVEDAGIDHPFLRHEWVRTWWDSFRHEGRLHILIVKADQDILGIVPLMADEGRMYGMKLRRLQGLANVYTERFDFILAKRPAEACRAVWNYLQANAQEWDVLELRQLPAGSRALEFLPQIATQNGYLTGQWHANDAPYIRIGGSWEAYFKKLNKKHRAAIRKGLERLTELGDVGVELATSPGDGDRDFDEALRLEAAAWKGQEGTALANDRTRRGFYLEFVRRASEQGWLRLYFLTVRDVRIAIKIAVQYANKWFFLKSGYDPHYAFYTPSHLLNEKLIRAAHDAGIAEVDFLGNAERWKMSWANETRPHTWLYIFAPRPRLRLLYGFKFRVLPLLKRSPLGPSLLRAVARRRLRLRQE